MPHYETANTREQRTTLPPASERRRLRARLDALDRPSDDTARTLADLRRRKARLQRLV